MQMFKNAIEKIISDKLSYMAEKDNVFICPSNVCEGMNKSVSNKVINLVKWTNNIQTCLSNCCKSTVCGIKDDMVFRCLPNGAISSKIMLIYSMPTQYEMYAKCAFVDKDTISVREALEQHFDVYYTPMIKCSLFMCKNYSTNSSSSVNECINSYLYKEICDIIRPEVIIFYGNSINGAIKYNILPKDISQYAKELKDVGLRVNFNASQGLKQLETTILFSENIDDINRQIPIIQNIIGGENGR